MIHPTMCEYCYRGRILLAAAFGSGLGWLAGGYALPIAGALVALSFFVSIVLPALRNG